MMKITGLSHLFKWENLHNWWLTKYFFAPLYLKKIEYHEKGQYFLSPISESETHILYILSLIIGNSLLYHL